MPDPEVWTLRWKNLSCLPVCHYRLEYADLVRLRIRTAPPDALALELPSHLAPHFLQAVRRLPELSVLLFQNATGETLYLPVEPADPFVEAVRSALEMDIPVHLVDINLEQAYPPFRDPVPDTYAIHRIGTETYYRAFRSVWQEQVETHPLDAQRERGMAFRLQDLMKDHGEVLFVCGMIHGKGVLDRLPHPQATPLHQVHAPAVQVFHLDPGCLEEVLATFPLMSALYEVRRSGLPPEPARDRYTVRRSFSIRQHAFRLLQREAPVYDEAASLEASLAWIARRAGFEGEPEDRPGPLDRNRALWHLTEEAGRHYREETGETVRPWQRRVFWKFARNHALLDGLLLPEMYHLLVAGRATVEDNYAYNLWRLGGFYPWQRSASAVPTLRVRGEDVWLGTRRLRVRRWLPSHKRQRRPPLRKLRKRENVPGEWLQSFDGSTLCSYPPEDIVVEEYGRMLRERWHHILRDEADQTEPFLSSLHDGIDLRETIRKWPERRIYVRRRATAQGGAGAIVLIFDEDEADTRFPYRMTWLGEHEQESDMAFYATPPEDHLVGPGICRCEYGGFLMTYPPRRLFDVWRDPDYRFARSKSEVLLAAAMDYSLERNVVYVAARPPRSHMYTLAERVQRQIAYIPVGSLSPPRIRALRVFHILTGYDKRNIAKDYVL